MSRLLKLPSGKGQSETHPQLSPNDEFANYELGNIGRYPCSTKVTLTGSYVRQAYGVGQELYEKLGANPFKYGLEKVEQIIIQEFLLQKKIIIPEHMIS